MKKKYDINPGRRKTEGFKPKNVRGLQRCEKVDVDASLALEFKEKGYSKEKRISREFSEFRQGTLNR